MEVLGVLGVVIVRGVRDFRVRITIVPLAKLAAAVVIAAALGGRRTLFPVYYLAGTAVVVTGDIWAATSTTCTAILPPTSGRTAVLASAARLHGLARILRLIFEIVFNGRVDLGPFLLRPEVAQTAVFADLAIPYNRPPFFRLYLRCIAIVGNGKAARKELDELLDVSRLVQLRLPTGRHCAEVIG
jgi:hypothetical protein